MPNPAGLSSLLVPILLLAFFYFILLRPEQKKQKQAREMINNLKVGDKVMSRGGIYGVIVAMEDEKITLATGPDMVKITMSKYSVANIAETVKAEEKTEAAPYKENPDTEEKAK